MKKLEILEEENFALKEMLSFQGDEVLLLKDENKELVEKVRKLEKGKTNKITKFTTLTIVLRVLSFCIGFIIGLLVAPIF